MNHFGNVSNEQGGVKTPFPCGRSVVDFLREIVRAQPNLPAVKDAGRTMTHEELDLRSNLVADRLKRCGLHLEEPVAILIPASGEYVVAMLGILKAGGAYVPLDPNVPVRRLEFLLQDSGSRFALTDAAGTKRIGGWSGTTLDLAAIIGQPGPEAHKISGVPSDPNRRAYIIYTSGSTGQPKGVEIEHHSLTNLVCAYHERFNLSARDRSTLFANVAFDASVADVWPTLCASGCLVVPPRELIQHPDCLIAWLADEEITWTFVPTGLAEILFDRVWPAQVALRFLMTGGDRLRVRPPQNLPFTVLNAYGPTENTVISTWSVLKAQNDNSQLPAIGRPIANVQTFVLDEHGQPVADGVAGELYLGGEQVARGYLGQPALRPQNALSPIHSPDCRRPGCIAPATGCAGCRTANWISSDGTMTRCRFAAAAWSWVKLKPPCSRIRPCVKPAASRDRKTAWRPMSWPTSFRHWMPAISPVSYGRISAPVCPLTCCLHSLCSMRGFPSRRAEKWTGRLWQTRRQKKIRGRNRMRMKTDWKPPCLGSGIRCCRRRPVPPRTPRSPTSAETRCWR